MLPRRTLQVDGLGLQHNPDEDLLMEGEDDSAGATCVVIEGHAHFFEDDQSCTNNVTKRTRNTMPLAENTQQHWEPVIYISTRTVSA